MLEKGAKINGSGNGIVPLHYAVSLNGHEMVKLLLTKGADATIPNSKGEIPFLICACHHTRLNMNMLKTAKELVPYTDYELVKDKLTKAPYYSIDIIVYSMIS